MKDRLLHTPEGVRDIYNDECERKKELMRRIEDTFHSCGYRDIETPTMEYFDVFGYEIGTIPSRELFKFFDREGDTMVLRPDFTPSIARACSKYFMEEGKPIRLCYQGSTFVNHSSLQGRLRESTQMGVELIGEESVDADAEVIAMVIDSLLGAGLQDFQITLGHAGFFAALSQDAGLDEETAGALRDLIKNRNVFGVEKMLQSQDLPADTRDILSAIPNLFGDGQMLLSVLEQTKSPKAARAVSRLIEVWKILQLYGVSRYVSFDLGMMSNYKYYTGIIFRGYTYAAGEPIVKGGRYDRLLSFFGKDAPAIGFVIVTDTLLEAMTRQHIDIPVSGKKILIRYSEEKREEAIRQAKERRKRGERVTLSVCGKDINAASETENNTASYDEICCFM